MRDARRLRVLADGYGCDLLQRRDLPEATLHKVRGMFWLLRRARVPGANPGPVCTPKVTPTTGARPLPTSPSIWRPGVLP